MFVLTIEVAEVAFKQRYNNYKDQWCVTWRDDYCE